MAPPTTRRDLLKWSVSVPFLAMREDSTAQRPTIAATTTAILADPVYKQHDPGAGHPERPDQSRVNGLTVNVDSRHADETSSREQK